MAIGSALSTLESARFVGLRVSSGDDVQHFPRNRTSVLAHNCRWLPQEICTCQRISRCAGVTIDSSTTNSQSGNIVGRYFLDSKKVSISCRSLRKYSLPVRALLTSKTPDVSTRPIVGEEKIGVLLLNLGGPETLEDVQPFLYNLFADPDIIRLPRLFRFLQKPLAQFISIARAPKSKEGYASIGGGSPLRQITDEQAEELRKALFKKDVPAKVYVGMRYWHPFTEEAIEEMAGKWYQDISSWLRVMAGADEDLICSYVLIVDNNPTGTHLHKSRILKLEPLPSFIEMLKKFSYLRT